MIHARFTRDSRGWYPHFPELTLRVQSIKYISYFYFVTYQLWGTWFMAVLSKEWSASTTVA